MATPKPTILLIQGSFQLPLVYKFLTDSLISDGYPTVHPPLPSCTSQDHPNFTKTTLIDDALAVRMQLIRLIEYEFKTVVVVMHSYGGLVGSEAIPPGLTFLDRKKRGLKGGVIHLFFFAAFLLEVGQSVLSAFGESPNNDVRPDGRFYVRNAAEIIYNDLPSAEAKLWEERMVAQSYAVQETKLTRAAYTYIPCTYLVCENDQAAPVVYQERFAEMAGATVVRCGAGHSPMLSQVDVLVRRIGEAVERAVEEEGEM